MTTVLFGRNDNARWMMVSGHAGYAESGKDIVCAGVSITAQGLAATLCQVEGVVCNVSKNAESLYVYCQSTEETKCYVDAVFDMARTSLEMLAEEYPNHVKVD